MIDMEQDIENGKLYFEIILFGLTFVIILVIALIFYLIFGPINIIP